jgi:DNA helicase II / ATP-dependent DNA helicase PcrA
MERNPFKTNPLKSNSYMSLSPDVNDRLRPAGTNIDKNGRGSSLTGSPVSKPTRNRLNDMIFQKPYAAAAPKDIAGSNMGTIDYGVGDAVQHIKFGVGIVTNINAGGKDFEVTVDFPNFGTKKMLASFAKMKKL